MNETNEPEINQEGWEKGGFPGWLDSGLEAGSDKVQEDVNIPRGVVFAVDQLQLRNDLLLLLYPLFPSS